MSIRRPRRRIIRPVPIMSLAAHQTTVVTVNDYLCQGCGYHHWQPTTLVAICGDAYQGHYRLLWAMGQMRCANCGMALSPAVWLCETGETGLAYSFN